MKQEQRAKLMRLSWQIQHHRHYNRSKSLTTAWVFYLIVYEHARLKYGGDKKINYKTAASFNQ